MVNADKPFKAGICPDTGLPIVIKLVPNGVKEFLEIMEAVQGSYVKEDKKTNTYYLIMPGQNPYEINNKFKDYILQCLSEDALTDNLYLCKLSLKTIRSYER